MWKASTLYNLDPAEWLTAEASRDKQAEECRSNGPPDARTVKRLRFSQVNRALDIVGTTFQPA